MVRMCAVFSCGQYSGHNSGVNTYKFPEDFNLRKKWRFYTASTFRYSCRCLALVTLHRTLDVRHDCVVGTVTSLSFPGYLWPEVQTTDILVDRINKSVKYACFHFPDD